MASSSNVPDGENTLDDLFEHFIETFYSTHTAIRIDTDADKKLQFKSYLFTALVPMTTVATGLGYTQEDPDFFTGSTDDKCHKILMNMIHKIEFIQSLDRKDDVQLLALLHHFTNQKLQKIKHNLLTYNQLTDLYNQIYHDC